MRQVAAILALILFVAATTRAEQVVRGSVGRRVDTYLTRLVPFGFSGAVLVAKGRDVLLKKGYGAAVRDPYVPFTERTVSSIGSITKQFTAAAILKLEMLGRLRVEDPIAKYLPAVPADKASITIHHLLTHTAGIPEDLGGGDAQPIGRDELVERVLATPLASAPGTTFEYSNEGYSLAGAIVERVSGQSYESFLREQLFLPLGMKDTGYLLPAWPGDRLARGYRADGAEWGLIHKRGWRPDGPGWYLHANGGIHSTLDDMLRWHLALDSDQVLFADARRKFVTGHVTAGGNEKYAYGWGVTRSRRKTTVISHNGGNGIYSADVRRYVDERTVIIALTNTPVVPAARLAPAELESLVFNDRPVAMPPRIIDAAMIPTNRQRETAGRYALGNGSELMVAASSEGLAVDTSDPRLLAALLGLSSAGPGGRFAALEARSKTAIEAASRGDVKPIFEAFNDDRTLGEVEAAQKRLWARWRGEFGDFIGAEVIGTGLDQGDPSVALRLRFSRSAPVLHLTWGPRRLFAARLTSSPRVNLRPESANTYAYFQYGQPPIRFDFRPPRVRITGANFTFSGRKPPKI